MTVPVGILDAASISQEDVIELFRQLSREVPADVELVRQGTNLILGSRSLIWRLSLGTAVEAVEANVKLVTELASSAPLVEPTTTTVASVGSACLTEWPRAGDRTENADPGDLGSCLAELQAIRAPAQLKAFGDFTKISARLRIAEEHGVPAEVIDAFVARSDETIPSMRDLVQSERTLLHGDAHLGNLVEYRGRSALIDLDDLCTGPHQLDLVPAYVSTTRLATGRSYWERIWRAYGENIETWPNLDLAVRYRELTMTTWLGTLWGTSPAVEREVRHRLATWDSPPGTHEPWNAF